MTYAYEDVNGVLHRYKIENGSIVEELMTYIQAHEFLLNNRDYTVDGIIAVAMFDTGGQEVLI